MKLHELKRVKSNKTKSKRRGRGVGSGKGAHTTGSGTKGQKSRSGSSIPFGFEGGQVPLHRKMPKIGGFRNPTTKSIAHISLKDLNKFKASTVVTPEKLLESKILKKLPKHGVKILANGDINKKLTLKGFLYSESAKMKLEAAGCKIQK